MAGRHREILAQIGRLAVSGQLPQGPTELLEVLVAQGFERDEVASVLGPHGAQRDAAQAVGARMAQLSEDATGTGPRGPRTKSAGGGRCR